LAPTQPPNAALVAHVACYRATRPLVHCLLDLRSVGWIRS
jgi:hypothetical protein